MEAVMGINVKNERVEAGIRLLAEKMGVGLTDAIEAGVQTRLAQIEAEHDAEVARKLAAIKEVQDRLRPHVPPGATSDCNDLYNEFGEPA
jgi:hypothetical protein